MKNKKHFFIVGAQRSATTYLYATLDEHPEICMSKPLIPEPKYFLRDHIQINEYHSIFFKKCKPCTKFFGEKSTSYYENEKVAQKISYVFPDAKIIFILANPIERALSNYKFSYENGLEKRTVYEVFIDNKPIQKSFTTSVNPFSYLERGLYYQYIQRYLQYFPKENIKVLIKEKFVSNITEVQGLYKWLGVSTDFIPKSLNKKINSSSITPDIPEEVMTFLNKYYQIPIAKLQTVIDREITEW